MWGAVVRNAREWVRLTTVYFPEQLQPEALAFIQVRHNLCKLPQWSSLPLPQCKGCTFPWQEAGCLLWTILCMQAFAIVLKGKVRPGRTRSDPNDRTACRYDVEVKVRRVRCLQQPRQPLYLSHRRFNIFLLVSLQLQSSTVSSYASAHQQWLPY